MSEARTVLVLGAGVGGVVAANRLRALPPKQDQVVVIDRERDHLFAPSLRWHFGEVLFEKYWLWKWF